MKKLPYAFLGIAVIITFSIGGWFRFVAIVMAAIGMGCWFYEKKHLPRIVPLVLVAALLIPFLSACGVPEHPIPISAEAVAPTADTGCVIAVAATGATGIYTFAQAPVSWVAVTLFGAGLPSLSACQYEFGDTFTLRVWYDCGQGPRYFITAADINHIQNVFARATCSSQTGNYIPDIAGSIW